MSMRLTVMAENTPDSTGLGDALRVIRAIAIWLTFRPNQKGINEEKPACFIFPFDSIYWSSCSNGAILHVSELIY